MCKTWGDVKPDGRINNGQKIKRRLNRGKNIWGLRKRRQGSLSTVCEPPIFHHCTSCMLLQVATGCLKNISPKKLVTFDLYWNRVRLL